MGQALQTFPVPGEEVGPLVRGKEDLVAPAAQQRQDGIEVALRLPAEEWRAVETGAPPREPREGQRVGIDDFHVVSGESQGGERFARREARPLGHQDAGSRLIESLAPAGIRARRAPGQSGPDPRS